MFKIYLAILLLIALKVAVYFQSDPGHRFWWEYCQYHHSYTLTVNWISLSFFNHAVLFVNAYFKLLCFNNTTTKTWSSMWLNQMISFAIAHKRNTFSVQVLWQDYNSLWFKFWLYLINAEMDKKKDSIRSNLAGAYAMAMIEFKSLQYWL